MDNRNRELLALQLLHSSAQCGIADPRLQWIDEQASWQRVYAQVNRQRMMPPPAPLVDFNQDGVVLIAMGTQRSGGYQLSLADAPATLENGILTIPVIWRTPERGYRHTQVMGSACLLVQLAQQRFSTLRVVGQNQQVLLEQQL